MVVRGGGGRSAPHRHPGPDLPREGGLFAVRYASRAAAGSAFELAQFAGQRRLFVNSAESSQVSRAPIAVSRAVAHRYSSIRVLTLIHARRDARVTSVIIEDNRPTDAARRSLAIVVGRPSARFRGHADMIARSRLSPNKTWNAGIRAECAVRISTRAGLAVVMSGLCPCPE